MQLTSSNPGHTNLISLVACLNGAIIYLTFHHEIAVVPTWRSHASRVACWSSVKHGTSFQAAIPMPCLFPFPLFVSSWMSHTDYVSLGKQTDLPSRAGSRDIGRVSMLMTPTSRLFCRLSCQRSAQIGSTAYKHQSWRGLSGVA